MILLPFYPLFKSQVDGATKTVLKTNTNTFKEVPILEAKQWQEHDFFVEPGLLDELERRVEEAERKFQAADLDFRLKELEAARQRQVKAAFELVNYF